ncbi:MAG TPA: hypothetical protein VLT86_16140 [Vicinamibacterales bacterium]|nr:hypothetical protein [Vicinamibacterales bacterium]
MIDIDDRPSTSAIDHRRIDIDHRQIDCRGEERAPTPPIERRCGRSAIDNPQSGIEERLVIDDRDR